jgi:hypothetical protein
LAEVPSGRPPVDDLLIAVLDATCRAAHDIAEVDDDTEQRAVARQPGVGDSRSRISRPRCTSIPRMSNGGSPRAGSRTDCIASRSRTRSASMRPTAGPRC